MFSFVDFIAKSLAGYLLKKGFDKLFNNPKQLTDALASVIDETISDYQYLYPQEDVDQKHAFFKSQRVVSELLRYRVMHHDYELADLHEALLSEPNVIPPTREEITVFYEIFVGKIGKDDKLRQLELSTTFKEEIFLISQKINELCQLIGTLLSELHTSLEAELKRQLEVYGDAIKAFNPKTALSFLQKLQNSIDTQKQPSDQIIAAIEYQKGICYKLMGNASDSCKSFIIAYNSIPTSKVYQERAAISYNQLSDPKAATIADDLLQKDAYNVVGWAVKTLCNASIEDFLNSVPPIVKEDITFRRIVFYGLMSDPQHEGVKGIARKTPLLLDYRDYKETEITVDNFYEMLFWLESALDEYLQEPILFTAITFENIHLLHFLNTLLKKFVSIVEQSELSECHFPYKFFLAHTEFLLTRNPNWAIEMKKHSNPGSYNFFYMLLINNLQLAGHIEEALEVISTNKIDDAEIIHLKAYCYLKKGDMSQFCQLTKEYLSSITLVDSKTFRSLFPIPLALKSFNLLDNFSIEDFCSEKTFEIAEYELTYFSVVKMLKNGLTNEIKQKLIDFSILNKESWITSIIATAFYEMGAFDDAINIFRSNVDMNHESPDLYYYILSLDKRKKDNDELLKLLKHWRKEFSYCFELLSIEADLRHMIGDWDECIEICEYALKMKPENEAFLVLYFISLNQTDNSDSKVKMKELGNKLYSYRFKSMDHVGVVFLIFTQNDQYRLAIDFLYKYAIDGKNKQLRTLYFTHFIQRPEGTIPNPDIVEEGCYVKYSINNNHSYVEINEKENRFSQHFVNKKVGNTFTIKQPMSDLIDTVEIVEIITKYQYLSRMIMKEVENNPYSGMPLQSFTVEESGAKDIREALIGLFGAKGSSEKQKREDILNDYYNFKISYSMLVLQVLRGDYMAGYFHLIHYESGYTTPPLVSFPKFDTFLGKEFVLDFPSLIMLHHVSIEYRVEYPLKFLIAKQIADTIKSSIKQEKIQPYAGMSMTITLDGIKPFYIPEEATEQSIKYWESLLVWINQNCKTVIPEHLLDILRSSEDEDVETRSKYAVNNLLLIMDKPNRILISEDTYSILMPQSGQFCSTELYLKHLLGNKHPALDEFIKRRYIGYTISVDQLIREYKKKIIGQTHNYQTCVNNLSLALNPTTRNIETAVSFIKTLSLDAVVIPKILELETINIFVTLFQGIDYPKAYRLTRLLIYREFKLLGNSLGLILTYLDNAISIIEFNKI